MESSSNTLIIGLVIALIVLIALWAWSRNRKADVPPAKVDEKPAPKPEALVAPPPPAADGRALDRRSAGGRFPRDHVRAAQSAG